MRTPTLSILSFLAISATAVAQQNQPPITLNPQGQATGLQAQPVAKPGVALDPANSRLDALLLQWEQKMHSVSALEADISRSETDPVQKTTDVFQGRARFLRPNRASLYLQKTTNAQVYEHYIFTGNFLYDYRPQSKVVRIYEIPMPLPGRQAFDDNSFLGFLTGMKASDAKQRFDLTLAKEDEHYVYLFVVPKVNVDKQEFVKARLVLWKATFLPRQLEFESPNGTIIKWDIPRLDTTAKVSAGDFTPPPAPKDWKTEKVPIQNQPPAATPAAQPQPSKFRPAGQ